VEKTMFTPENPIGALGDHDLVPAAIARNESIPVAALDPDLANAGHDESVFIVSWRGGTGRMRVRAGQGNWIVTAENSSGEVVFSSFGITRADASSPIQAGRLGFVAAAIAGTRFVRVLRKGDALEDQLWETVRGHFAARFVWRPGWHLEVARADEAGYVTGIPSRPVTGVSPGSRQIVHQHVGALALGPA
jgi:hypothetical protein